jgi:NTP pyrophosphatase (non-canonical NTP hydrolase)
MSMTVGEMETIEKGVRVLQREVHTLAVEKGWWDDPRPIPELLALMHSEISEALEAYREAPSLLAIKTCFVREDGKPEGFASELADVVIRVLDAAESLGIDLGEVILQKHAFNQTRALRHGGKRC